MARPPNNHLTAKSLLIEEILSSSSPYEILGCTASTTPADLRRHYLDRSKIVHPDKLPYHPSSTLAFQHLSHAYEILTKGPDDPGRESTAHLYGDGEMTFRKVVSQLLHEFLYGDFRFVRKLLETLNRQYPTIVTGDAIVAIEASFKTLRELVLTTKTYALILSIELGRLHRVQKRLSGMRYLDVYGRLCCSMQLVRVGLAIPVRVDRAVKRRRREKRQRWEQQQLEEEKGLLNEKVVKVLEFIVGREVEDMPEDDGWGTPRAA